MTVTIRGAAKVNDLMGSRLLGLAVSGTTGNTSRTTDYLLKLA